jgi:hypothetical protein
MQALGENWGAAALPPNAVEIHIPRSAPVHRGARVLLEAWRARQAEGHFVVGRDVPSRDLARVLSGLALYEPLYTGDFRVRLAGHALRRRFGRDITGETLSRLMDQAQFSRHAAQMHRLLAGGQPLIVEVRIQEEERLCLCYELVALRVFAPDGRTPWVLSGLFFHDWRL